MTYSKKERTFVAVKPDGVHRALVGEIIKRIERTGLKIVGLKMFLASRDKLIEHYGKDDAWCISKGETLAKNLKEKGKESDKTPLELGKGIVEQLLTFMTAGPIVGMVIEGNKSVDIVKKLVGGTEPSTSDVGTIRGDFTIDSYDLSNVDGRATRNLVHCSDKPSEAEREINIWFRQDELIPYNSVQDKILYDVNIDGILE